jgi:cyanophycinase
MASQNNQWNDGLPGRLKEESWFLPTGTLIIGGGGDIPEFDAAIAEYAGGKDAPIVYVPSADAMATAGPFPPGFGSFKEGGFTNVRTLHTRNRHEADSAEFVKPLADAKCVLFGGGET